MFRPVSCRRRQFVTPLESPQVRLIERRVSLAVERNMILRLMGEHVDQEQFDICPSPLFGVKRVAPDVRKFVERGVVILGAKLNNLVVKICLAILMMVLPAATSRDVVMECQNF